MFTVVEPIPSLNHTVTNPVVVQLIGDILKQTGLAGLVNVVYRGEAIQATTTREPRFDNEGVLEITATIVPSREVSPTERPELPEAPLMFLHEDTGLSLRPIDQTLKYTLSFSLRTSRQDTAKEVSARIRTVIQGGRRTRVHRLDYMFHTPSAFITLLTDCYGLLKDTTPNFESIQSWFSNCFHPECHVVSDYRDNQTIAQRRCSVGIIGQYLATDDITVSRNDAQWVCEWEYETELESPYAMTVKYPMSINTIDLGDQYLPSKETIQTIPEYGTHTNSFVSHYLADDALRIPHYDPWVCPVQRGRLVVATVKITVDLDNPTDVMNLLDTPGLYLNPVLAEWMREHPEEVVSDSPLFRVTLYSGDEEEFSGSLTCDDKLQILTTQPMSKRKDYHLVLSLIRDVTRVTSGVYNLVANPQLFRVVISALGGEGSLPDWLQSLPPPLITPEGRVLKEFPVLINDAGREIPPWEISWRPVEHDEVVLSESELAQDPGRVAVPVTLDTITDGSMVRRVYDAGRKKLTVTDEERPYLVPARYVKPVATDDGVLMLDSSGDVVYRTAEVTMETVPVPITGGTEATRETLNTITGESESYVVQHIGEVTRYELNEALHEVKNYVIEPSDVVTLYGEQYLPLGNLLLPMGDSFDSAELLVIDLHYVSGVLDSATRAEVVGGYITRTLEIESLTSTVTEVTYTNGTYELFGDVEQCTVVVESVDSEVTRRYILDASYRPVTLPDETLVKPTGTPVSKTNLVIVPTATVSKTYQNGDYTEEKTKYGETTSKWRGSYLTTATVTEPTRIKISHIHETSLTVSEVESILFDLSSVSKGAKSKMFLGHRSATMIVTAER